MQTHTKTRHYDIRHFNPDHSRFRCLLYSLWITFRGDFQQKDHIISMRKMYEIYGTDNVLNCYSQGGAFKINSVQRVFHET